MNNKKIAKDRAQRSRKAAAVWKKAVCFVLAAFLCLGVTACGSKTEDEAVIRMAVLTGPTGIGASSLMEKNEAGETVNKYEFTVAAANDEVTAGLISGEFDIAAVATNVAANLYQKTQGGVQIAALNTLGVLYILENGDTVHSMADLKGKKLLAAGQGANPEFVLEYLLTQNGLTYSTDGSEADVQIEFQPADAISTAMAAGDAGLCLLPVPAVTSVTVQNPDVRMALDLTAQWNAVTEEGELTMGCIVVRKEFAEAHPKAVESFLEEYAASIEAVKEDPTHGGELCQQYGIVVKAAVATKAIPSCNLVCITGDEMKEAILPYYNVLFEADPSSIGGTMPDDGFFLQ